MKISKVDHTRTGFSVQTEADSARINPSGVIYDNPVKEKGKSAERDMWKHIVDCNRKAQKLYNLLNTTISFTNNKNEQKIYAEAVQSFNVFIKKVLDCSSDLDLDTLVKEQMGYIERSSGLESGDLSAQDKNNIKENLTDVMAGAETLVYRNLRRSLRKNIKVSSGTEYTVTDLTVSLFKAYFSGNKFQQEFQKIPEDAVQAYLRLLNEDYRKDKQLKDIRTSIERQTVKIKVVEVDGVYRLIPANADHNKKKYIFEFMRSYADADEPERETLMKHMRRLIILYYCGADEYQKVKNAELAEWNFGQFISDRNEPFHVGAYELACRCEKGKGKIDENRRWRSEAKKLLSDEICSHYRKAAEILRTEYSTEEKTEERFPYADLFWIDYFEKTAEKILITNNNKLSSFKFSLGYLCDHTWKEWTSFISSKFIDFGKAVYHFVMPDLSGVAAGEEVSIGEVLSQYRNGISSFEYERIKAQESLEREMAEYVTFAVNNFARASCSDEERNREGREDVLQMKTESELQDSNRNKAKAAVLYSDADRRILQFFGGKSGLEEAGSVISVLSGEELFKAFKKELNHVRNAVFHYTGKISENMETDAVVLELFDYELETVGSIYRKKYFSNNVPMFYKVSLINRIMDKLYNEPKERPAQIPAFNRVLSRPGLSEFLDRFIKGKPLGKLKSNRDSTLIEKYRSSMFFLLKEIYYYDFIQEGGHQETGNKGKSVKEYFFEALAQQRNNEKDRNRQKALKDFDNRIHEIGCDRAFGEICQGLMVEYMLQNTGNPQVHKQIKANKNIEKDDPNERMIYKHFRTLLYVCIREAFFNYLKENWDILREPVYEESQFHNLTEDKFCGGWQAHTFDYLKGQMQTDPMLPAWYAAAHFMNPKHLNHLIGSIRTYIQFTEDIERRAASLYNRTVDIEREMDQYRKILSVLEFSMLFCGRTTGSLKDYFKDEAEYAEFLSHFVGYSTSRKVPDIETALHNFCNRNVGSDNPEGRIGIYYDGRQIIPNRNVILSHMYGNTRILEKCMTPVSEREIRDYYKVMKELADVLKNGRCESEEEQKKYRSFQNAKNRIELLDIQTYTELINDLQGQLVNWIYLRERDLMYFQLGFYYTKLFYGDSIGEHDFRRRLSGPRVNLKDGAILYQLVAVNTFALKVIVKKKDVYAPVSGKGSSTGSAVSQFVNQYCGGDETVYNAGLCLFENVREHDQIIKTRNYIAHFKYFGKCDRSILDLYSEIYDRFFRYDLKLKKSMSFVLPNILLKYFVNVRTEMHVREKEVEGTVHKAALLSLCEKKALESTYLTYKIPVDKCDKKKEVLVAARSEIFLEQLKKILEYEEG